MNNVRPCSIRANIQTGIFRFGVIFGATDNRTPEPFRSGSGANDFQCKHSQSGAVIFRAGLKAFPRGIRRTVAGACASVPLRRIPRGTTSAISGPMSQYGTALALPSTVRVAR